MLIFSIFHGLKSRTFHSHHDTTQPNTPPHTDPSPHPRRCGATTRGEGGRTTTEGGGGRRRTTTEEGGGGQPPPKEEGVRRSEPPSYGEVEGIHFNILSSASPSEEGRGREASPKRGGEGSTTKKRGSQRFEESTTAQKEEGREKFTSPFWWGVFPLHPFGWC